MSTQTSHDGRYCSDYGCWLTPSSSVVDPAEDAYNKAVEALKEDLSVTERTWLRRQHTINDVQGAVTQALREYRARSKGSKVQEWLSSCSARVMYYGEVLDTFSNHHPEYVSLAWGAMKFLFISILAHEELLAEISKAISNLGDVLPRTELHAILYPTTRMREAVALLYAKIIEFIVKAIKWCKKGKLRHAFTAIAHPFELKFKAITDEITLRSRRVDELASAASKAEIRDLHLKIHGMGTTLQNLGHQLTEMAACEFEYFYSVFYSSPSCHHDISTNLSSPNRPTAAAVPSHTVPAKFPIRVPAYVPEGPNRGDPK